MSFPATPNFGDGAAAGGAGGSTPGGKRANRGRRTASRPARVGASRGQRSGASTGAAWKAGNELAEALAVHCGPRVVALHGRQAPGGRLEFDHLVVAPSGVWVIGSGRNHGRIEVNDSPLRRPQLLVGGVDRTELVDRLDDQVSAVAAAMVRIDPRVAVRGALCFVTPKGLLHDHGLPVIRPLTMRGYELTPPRRVARLLLADDAIVPLSPVERTRLARALAQRFPAARTR